MKKQLFTILVIAFCVFSGNAQDVPFTKRLSNDIITVKGDITFVANNILNRVDATSSSNDPYDLSGTNGQLNLEYIDIDNDPTTFSSSSSFLSLPSCSKVVFAGLYWSGIYAFETWEGEEPRATTPNNIKFKLPGGNYQDISSDEVIFDNGIATQRPYVCFKDMTSIVGQLADPNGEYIAANIRATQGLDSKQGLGGSAGWVLVVVYENPNETEKSISIFDGFSTVEGFQDTDVIFSGIQTNPIGEVKVKALVGALEGDWSFAGDRFQIKDTNGVYTNIGNDVNDANNFFNGSISQGNNHVIDRLPASKNTLGFDIDMFEIDNPNNTIIANNQNKVEARFTTDGDVYWAFLNAISVELRKPDIRVIHTIDDGAGNDLDGGMLNIDSEYWCNIQMQNVGNDDATNTLLNITLPKKSTVNTSSIVTPIGVSYSYVSPSIENDFVGQLSFSVSDLLLKENSAIHQIRYQVQLANECDDFKDACSNLVDNQSFLSYTGVSNGVQISNEPSAKGVDFCNLDVVSPASFYIDISNCTSVTTSAQICNTPIELTAGAGFDIYEWRNSTGNIIGATQTITIGAVGEYFVTKSNTSNTASECANVLETFNVTAGTPPTFTTTSTDPVCFGSDNGSIEVNISSGESPFTYLITKKSGNELTGQQGVWNSQSNSFENLPAGNYEVQIADKNGCTSPIVSLTLVSSPELNVTASIANRTISLNANGGVPPYEYSIEDGSFTSNTVFNVEYSGEYIVNVRDANGCINSVVAAVTDISNDLFVLEDTFTTEQNVPIDLNVFSNDVNIPVTGSLSLTTPSNGSLSIDDLGTLDDISDDIITYSPDSDFLGTDSFDYTVCNASGDFCDTTTVTITINPVTSELQVTITTSDVTCFGGTNGVVEVLASGGTEPYSFELIDLSNSSSVLNNDTGNFNNLKAGDYSVKVTDGVGNFVEQSVVISEPIKLTGSLETYNVSCNGGSDAYIVVNASGGSENYSYEISSSPGVFQIDNEFRDLNAGVYDITIMDDNGCSAVITGTVISEPDELYIGYVNIVNSGNLASGKIEVNGGGGTPEYFYSFNGGPFSETNSFYDLAEGDYTIELRDASGCIANPLTVTISSIDVDNTVNKVSDGLEAVYKNAISYQWIDVDTNERITEATQATFTPTKSGNYQVEMEITQTATKVVSKTTVNKNNTQIVLSPVVAFNSGVLSVNDVDKKILKAYPNPASERIILPSELINLDYKIYSVVGQEVQSSKISSEEIKIEKLSKGIYILRINGYQPLRFVKK